MGKPKKQVKPRSPAEEEADRRNISRLYLKGLYQVEIAKELGISQSTVSRDIQYLIDEWKKERVYDINEAKARELAKIDNLELEYWDAWRRSKEDAETKTKKAVKTPEGVRQEQQEQYKGQAGDPRFLQGIQWCIEQRCKILGVEAPKKIAGDGDENAIPIRIVEVVKKYEDK